MQKITNGEAVDSPYWLELEVSQCGRYSHYFLCHKDPKREGFTVRKELYCSSESSAFRELLEAEVEAGVLTRQACEHALMTQDEIDEWIAKRRQGGEILDWG